MAMQKFPKRYVERIKEILPESEWDLFFEKVVSPIPRSIRGDRGFQASSKFKVLNSKGWNLKKTAIDDAFFIEPNSENEEPLGKTLEHFTGNIYIQSLSSMLPVDILNPQPEEKILDLCAAPGSKTTFLAQKMGNAGCIIANEISGSRSKRLVANCNRMGITNTVITQTDGVAMSAFLGQEFDRILLDAPCSSEGFGRKDPQYFEKMWSEPKIFTTANLQKKLIESAFRMLKPEGIMIYSTCTSAPEENEFVVQHLLDTYGEFVELLEFEMPNIPSRGGISSFSGQTVDEEITKKSHRIYPHLQTEEWDSEAFYLILIRKKYGLPIPPPRKAIVKDMPEIYKKNKQAETVSRLCKRFGIEKKKILYSEAGIKQVLVQKNNEIFITSREAAGFCQKNLFRRLGIRILDKDKNITTQFAMKYGKWATANTLELTVAQKDRWLAGYDLIFTPEITEDLALLDGPILVKYEGFCLGYGKMLNKAFKLKNKLDRDLTMAYRS